MNSELSKLKKQLGEANGIIKYLEEQNRKRIDLSIKQTELETRRLEAKIKFTVKDYLVCFIAFLMFLLGCYTVHEHFSFLKHSLSVESETLEDTHVKNKVVAEGISSVENSDIGVVKIANK